MKLFILLGMIGWWQIVVILVVVLLLFGGKKIPELMKGVGRGIKEFKDGVNPKEEDEKKKKDEDSEEKK
ncbi:MAG: twin-arginine translocase TatA/TatE family subunit [Bacteroidales bacterium]|nr:twin-arginine translocase TatA/TatE family subunit [Bacteroidales bacterium]